MNFGKNDDTIGGQRAMRPAATEMAARGVLELGGRQPAVLLRPCLQPFPSPAGSGEFFGRETGAGSADEAAGLRARGRGEHSRTPVSPRKTAFPLVHRG